MTGPLVIPAAELEKNEKRIVDLHSLVSSGRSVLFAGAGLSVPAGYPRWGELLEELENLCEACGPGFVRDATMRDDAPLDYADLIQAHIRTHRGDDRYLAFMQRLFLAAPKIQRVHEDLVALPFRGFLTTNYDPTIEATLLMIEPRPPDKAVVIGQDTPVLRHRFLQSLQTVGNERQVAHLHGYYKSPAGIVLSARDFAETYGAPAYGAATVPSLKPVPSFLRVVLPAYPIVFIGFSFRDPALGAFLRAISDEYQLWGTNNHYAILDTDASTYASDVDRANKYKELYGIETVFYERIGYSHSALYDLVALMRAKIAPDGRARLIDIASRAAGVMRP